jgi:hypothetical protein
MNWEQEVKKVYPNAFALFNRDNSICIVKPIRVFGVTIYRKRIGENVRRDGFFATFLAAWQSAYEKLKKEGKI